MDRSEYTDLHYPLDLRTLPIPDGSAAEVDALRKRARLTTAKERARFEDSIRLRIHFGGMHVACVRTSEATLIVAAGLPGTGALRRKLQAYRGDRDAIVIESPQPLGAALESRT